MNDIIKDIVLSWYLPKSSQFYEEYKKDLLMIKKELKLNCNYLAAHLKFKRINNFIEQIYLSVTSSWTKN